VSARLGDAYMNAEIASLLSPVIGVAERATRNLENGAFVSDITPEVFDQVIDSMTHVKEYLIAKLVDPQWRSPVTGECEMLCRHYDFVAIGRAVTHLNWCEEQIRKILPGLFR